MNQSGDSKFEILIVEDNPGDLELMKEAWEDCRLSFNITVARHGEEAMDILFKRGGYSDAVVPDLIILDWNLPRRGGKEVLADIKTEQQLRTIPVIVLTTSDQERDIVDAYKLNANCYITKPVGLEQFLETIKNLGYFWLSTARLPRKQKQETRP